MGDAGADLPEIVDQHVGRIRAESTPGAGAVFSFTVPLAPVQPVTGDTMVCTGGLPT